MSMKCYPTEMRLAADTDHTSSHVEGCLRCQASRSRYRTLRREMRSLRDQLVTAPAGFPNAILSGAAPDAAVPRRFPTEAVAMAGLAAAAGAAAGALAWWRRHSA
jgi:hypothetical protein